jgi:endo-1,4-beta-xylanase
MKKIIRNSRVFVSVLAIVAMACNKIEDIAGPKVTPISYTDTTTPLKDAIQGTGDFPIGVAISEDGTKDAKYLSVLQSDFDIVTFENAMKHEAMVKADGSLDFARADAMINKLGSTSVHGHTLLWHQAQNIDYLNGFIFNPNLPGPELLSNGGFESSNTELTSWNIANTGNPPLSASITVSTDPSNAHSGKNSMKVVNGTNYGTEQWRVQVQCNDRFFKNNKDYVCSYWIKSSSVGSVRLATGPYDPVKDSNYQGDIAIKGDSKWQQVIWKFTVKPDQQFIEIDMGALTGTFYVDDVSIAVAATDGLPLVIDTQGIDNALKNYVTGMITHYNGKVKSWDVVNELFADNGQIRNESNTSSGYKLFVWSQYLGRDAGLKAFNYAKSANPNVDLYINDYGLEYSPSKLDALIAYVSEIRAKGAKVDGIGTQMHIHRYTGLQGIEEMFKKLAATGLKIKISELDINMTTNVKGESSSSIAFDQNQQMLQADIYHFVVSSYLKNIPPAQRGGISVWGVADNQSWLYNNGTNFPLLYNADYSRKMSYAGFVQALTGK